MTFRPLEGVDLRGKRALVRVDFNVPMKDGAVADDTRLRAALPTIERLRSAGAKVILMAHFDRPKGRVVPTMSLAPIVASLSRLLGCDVAFATDCVGDHAAQAISRMADGDVLLLENLRFHAGEEAVPALPWRARANTHGTRGCTIGPWCSTNRIWSQP